jgi:hypothetical protein
VNNWGAAGQTLILSRRTTEIAIHVRSAGAIVLSVANTDFVSYKRTGNTTLGQAGEMRASKLQVQEESMPNIRKKSHLTV